MPSINWCQWIIFEERLILKLEKYNNFCKEKKRRKITGKYFLRLWHLNRGGFRNLFEEIVWSRTNANCFVPTPAWKFCTPLNTRNFFYFFHWHHKIVPYNICNWGVQCTLHICFCPYLSKTARATETQVLIMQIR